MHEISDFIAREIYDFTVPWYKIGAHPDRSQRPRFLDMGIGMTMSGATSNMREHATTAVAQSETFNATGGKSRLDK